MAIIYSYPKQASLQSTDLLISTRFSTEPGVVSRSISFSLETLGEYIAANHTSTLNQVLTAGNTSLLDAKVGSVYLYDANPTAGYLRIAGNKNRINFYNKNDSLIGYIVEDSLVLNDISSDTIFTIKKPSGTTSSNTATFQDATGTVAYLSDIPASLPTANYGLFTQTVNSVEIVESNSERTLIGTGLGSLSVPAYGFNIGDSYRASLMGHISCLGSATLRIRVKAWNGFSYALLADTGEIDLDSVTDQHWSLDIGFTIRALGGADQASIVSGGSFYYNKTNGNIDLKNFVSENNTTFDTESDNEIVITAQFNNASASNSIYSNLFTLTKTY